MANILTVAETGSTNDALASMALEGAAEGLWLRAERQTGGKGRLGRAWVSPPGNLHASSLVRVQPGDPPAPTLALVAVVALHEVASIYAPGVQIKWPNDLLFDGAKLAGILLERSGDRIVAGFGVNLARAPGISSRKTAALTPTADITPRAFAPLLAGRFAQLLAAWRSSEPGEFAQAWLSRAHPVGTLLEVHSGPGDRVTGTFEGIEPDGAMRIRRDGAIDIIRAGDVTLA